jgi:Fur family ferric uptake transcriptional regulator
LKHATIVKRFEEFLRSSSLKLTPQRRRILDCVFATHKHFTADELYGWLREQSGGEDHRVSRATVYRTLDLLQRGGFIESLDTGSSELRYEHTLGHEHHDHMVCLECGRIEEFHEDRIEELQAEAARSKGFHIVRHLHRLSGVCRSCAHKLDRQGRLEEVLAVRRRQNVSGPDRA